MSWPAEERRVGDVRRVTIRARVPVPAVGPVDAEAKLVHVAVLDVLQRVLERTVGLLALVVLGEEAARRHALLVELVQEPALVALHAQAAQPVAAHRLSFAVVSIAGEETSGEQRGGS
jgi:hypothetical protein